MAIRYLNIYKWENLLDGTKEKFLYRLEVLPLELSLKTKLGCMDITMSIYLPESMYDKEMEERYKKAIIDYNLRQEKLGDLLELIKNNVGYSEKIGNEYLYELWISRIFDLDWEDDPLRDIDILSKKLLLNNKINPYDIDLKQIIQESDKPKKKINKLSDFFSKK